MIQYIFNPLSGKFDAIDVAGNISTNQIMGVGGLSGSSIDGNTWFLGTPAFGWSSTESENELYMPVGGTINRLFASAYYNDVTAPTTLILRKNGADTGLSVTFPASTIGLQSNIVDFLIVGAGDRICVKLVVPSVAGSKYFRWASISFSFTPS